MRPRRLHPIRRTWEFVAAKGVCAACHLQSQCTRAFHGRTIKRHEYQALLDRARGQAHSPEAYRDRCRRKHLAEGSFADAANNYHFKRSRWRRIWRQQIQDYLIGAIQNVKILMRNLPRQPLAALQHVSEAVITRCFAKVSALLKKITDGHWPYKHVVTGWVPV